MINVTCKIKKILGSHINVCIGTDSSHSVSANILVEFRFAWTLYIFFFFKQKTAYEISEWTGVQTCALPIRSEEHTSELQSHSEISYAVFCLRSEEHTTK